MRSQHSISQLRYFWIFIILNLEKSTQRHLNWSLHSVKFHNSEVQFYENINLTTEVFRSLFEIRKR